MNERVMKNRCQVRRCEQTPHSNVADDRAAIPLLVNDTSHDFTATVKTNGLRILGVKRTANLSRNPGSDNELIRGNHRVAPGSITISVLTHCSDAPVIVACRCGEPQYPTPVAPCQLFDTESASVQRAVSHRPVSQTAPVKATVPIEEVGAELSKSMLIAPFTACEESISSIGRIMVKRFVCA